MLLHTEVHVNHNASKWLIQMLLSGGLALHAGASRAAENAAAGNAPNAGERDVALLMPAPQAEGSAESPDPAAAAQEPPQPQMHDEPVRKPAAHSADAAAAPKAVSEPHAVASPSTANAKPADAAPTPSGPPALTWYGITLYGTIDVGVAHLSHGAPLSSTYGPSLPYIVQNYSNRPITSIASNGLSQSKIGLSAVEPLGFWGLKALFKIETGFQPTSGRLTDGPKSLVENNGVPLDQRITAGDSSRAGQPFQSAAYLGLGSGRLGTLTFGRQSSLMADDLMKYDPQLQSQAFSPIGFSGVSGGLGDTEDKILDGSLKYVLTLGPVHAAGLYQFGSRGYAPGGAESVDVGVEFAGLSLDALWGRVHGAISVSSLSAAQNATAPGTLAAVVSDNTAYAVMARYAAGPVKLYAGYEYITYANPADPIPNGTMTIGGYVLSDVNNAAFNIHKVLRYAWVGARVSLTPSLDVTGAYYDFRQNSYKAKACSNSSAGSCSGSYQDASLVADYKLSPRFDVYAGVNYSRAADGMAAGFLNQDDWTSMTGIRFNF